MTSLTILLLATNLLLFISAVRAQNFYQEVEGKCSDLPTLEEYDERMMAAGEWYYNYASLGEESDKCMTGHYVSRDLMNYGSILFFSSEINSYKNHPIDLTYHPDIPGRYTLTDDVTQVVAIDSDGTHFIATCVEITDQTKVWAMLASRSPKLDERAEAVYKQGTKILEKVKLLPNMNIVPQTDCPPLKKIEFFG